jgi:hypothetical protein
VHHSASHSGGSSELQQLGRSQWDVNSSLVQPGRAWSRVAATVMPCMRAMCVLWWVCTGSGRRRAEAAVGEFVGSREGVHWCLGALCDRYPRCTRPPWPWLAMQRPCGESGERDSDTIIQCEKPRLKQMILMATNVVRVCLYVRLTPYPLSHGPRGPIGWVGRGKSGPLNFTVAGSAVTVRNLH